MPFESVARDVRHSIRGWRRSPGFVVVAALTIALGIGATVTIFSIANTLLARTPPGVRDPGSLVTIAGEEHGRFVTLSYPTLEDFRNAGNGLGELAMLEYLPVSLSTEDDAEPELAAGLLVSASYFSILGTRPALGRFFLPGEDERGNPTPAVVLSHDTWQRRFGGDSSIVGRSITVNRHRFTVIGVTEMGFRGHYWMYDVGVFVPVTMAEVLTGADLTKRGNTSLVAVGRLAQGSSVVRVREAARLTTARLHTEYPDLYEDVELKVFAYSGMMEEIRTPAAGFLALLFMVSALVLLIASANVGGILLARAVGRSREMAVRLAVGARRTRLVRMLLTESILLFLVGGTAGTLLAIWATGALAGVQLPVPMPFAFEFTPDLRVLAFALLTAFVAGVLFGLAPALQSSKTNLATALKDERGAVSGRRIRLRNAFVVVQVSASAVLLIVGSLFLRTLGRAQSVDLGFTPNGLHVLSLDLSVHSYSREEGQQLMRDLVERSQSLPGVQAAAATSLLPLGFDWGWQTYTIPGREPVPGVGLVRAEFNAVSPGYFETMDIPVLAGRAFEPSDRAESPRVVVINEAAARSFWPGEPAVGKVLEQGDTRYEVVGVARDSKSRSIWASPEPAAYKAYAQSYFDLASIVVRTPSTRQGIAAELREIVRTLDPNLPLRTNAPYSQIVGLSLMPSRIAASVAGAFGALGVILAAVGLFGVLSYAVTQRTREIGIRLALGADVRDVRRLVLVGGLRLTLCGLIIGLALAFGGAQALRSMLYGLSPADPVAFGAITLLVVAVGSLASYLPARRATRTDPMEALRYDG